MIDATYGEVRSAYVALGALSREGLKIPLATALKWKRIRGVLAPLVEQSDEMLGELVREHAEKDEHGESVKGDQPGTVRLADPAAYSKAVAEALGVAVTVGCDVVSAADFGAADALVSSRLVDLLGELGPFFDDTEADHA